MAQWGFWSGKLVASEEEWGPRLFGVDELDELAPWFQLEDEEDALMVVGTENEMLLLMPVM